MDSVADKLQHSELTGDTASLTAELCVVRTEVREFALVSNDNEHQRRLNLRIKGIKVDPGHGLP